MTKLPYYSLALLVLAIICATSPLAVAEGKAIDVDIPAGKAAFTLRKLIALTELQIIYRPIELKGFRTRAVRGKLTPREALDKMLGDTPLEAVQDSASGAYAIVHRARKGGDVQSGSEKWIRNETNSKTEMNLKNDSTKPAAGFLKALLAFGTAVISNVSAQNDGEEDGVFELDAVVVTGLRQQLAIAAEAERQQKTIYSILTADDVGNFPDQTLAESLSRLPGVSVDDQEGEGRYVNIRGMPRDFAQVTVNNAQLGSSDAGGDRSVALDVVPGDLFQQVELGKSLLPDTDADSFGAKVDLRPLSAFRRPPGLIGRLSLRGDYGQLSGDWDPNIRANISKQFQTGGGRWGVAAALSYVERTVHGDQLSSDSGGGIRYANAADDPEGAEPVLYIRELDQRMERGTRERVGGTLVVDWDNEDNFRFQISGIYGRLHDDDIRVQQEVELRDASESETILLEPGHGIFTDVDLDRQIAFFGPTERTYAIHIESEYDFGAESRWTLFVGGDFSRNDTSMPTEANRGRWLERDQIVEAWWDKEGATYRVLGKGDYDNRDELDFDFQPTPADFVFDQLGVIEEDRFDEIKSYNVDLQRDVELGERVWTFKGGFKYRERDRGFLRGEQFTSSVNADAVGPLGYPTTLETVPTFVPDTAFDINGGIPGGAVFPDLEWTRNYLAEIRQAFGIEPTQLRNDYNAGEETDAAYLMASVDLGPRLEMIVGARYEETDYTAAGRTRNDIEIDVIDPNNPGETLTRTLLSSDGDGVHRHNYGNTLPGLFFVWDANEDVVARFSYSKGQVRPNFGQSNGAVRTNWSFVERAAAELDGYSGPFATVQLQGETFEVASSEEEYEIRLRGGNPFLDPIIADQFDFNVGWYPNQHSNLTLALYQKDMEDYIINVNTTDADIIGQLGGNAFDTVTGLATTRFSKWVNVSSADLSGIELAGRYGFVNAPGFLSDVHVSGNAAWLTGSTSTPFIDNGQEFDLPGLADFIGNFAVAYETEKFSLQLSARYRTDRLRSRDSDEPWKDQIDDSDFRLGANVRYRINEIFRVFANVQNITNEPQIRFHAGDEIHGALIKRRADFGRTWQMGVDARF